MTGTGPIFGASGAWLPRIKGVCIGTVRASKMLTNAVILNTNRQKSTLRAWLRLPTCPTVPGTHSSNVGRGNCDPKLDQR